MTIRKANIDDAPAIAVCLLLAMEDIVYTFIGEKNNRKATDFMEQLVAAENNQYSYQNCWVATVADQVVAAANVYDGARLSLLRQPVLDLMQQQYGVQLQPEAETEAGEYYLDSLGVQPHWRGKGIGTSLLQFLIYLYVRGAGHTLGLLVDKDNPKAKKLYLRLGFKPAGYKMLLGKQMEHLQVKP